MTAAEREEARSTYYVKSAGLWRVALAHAHTLLLAPAAILAVWRARYEAVHGRSTASFISPKP